MPPIVRLRYVQVALRLRLIVFNRCFFFCWFDCFFLRLFQFFRVSLSFSLQLGRSKIWGSNGGNRISGYLEIMYAFDPGFLCTPYSFQYLGVLGSFCQFFLGLCWIFVYFSQVFPTNLVKSNKSPGKTSKNYQKHPSTETSRVQLFVVSPCLFFDFFNGGDMIRHHTFWLESLEILLGFWADF